MYRFIKINGNPAACGANSIFLQTFCSYTSERKNNCVYGKKLCVAEEFFKFHHLAGRSLRGNMNWRAAGGQRAGRTLLVIHLARRNYALWNQPSKPSSRTVTHSLPSLVSLQRARLRTLPVPRTFPLPRRNSTIQCCFPCCTCDKGVEKYWQRQRLVC